MFDKVAKKYGSDKSSVKHGYTEFYEERFKPLVSKKVKIAELGLQIGGPELGKSKDRPTTEVPSINMWKELFPKAHIYGFDISDFSRFQDARFTFFRGDSLRIQDIKDFEKLFGEADIKVNDASHATGHQRNTIAALMPHAKTRSIPFDRRPPLATLEGERRYFGEDHRAPTCGEEDRSRPPVLSLLGYRSENLCPTENREEHIQDGDI